VRIAWEATGHAREPRGQRALLFRPYAAEIGPERRNDHGGWWWAVYRLPSKEPAAEGFAYDEQDAKQAVVEWAQPRAPRTLKRRLRAFKRSLR
jgi:hypothetical protein